ncbi:MAG: hypothetical protein WD448_10300 [Woeseia sp.]
MNVFTFLFLVATVAIIASLIRTYINARARNHATAEDTEETLLKIDRLEERIEVLERILTENRYDLQQEIDGL